MTKAVKKVIGKTDLVDLISAKSSVSKVDASNALNLVLDGISNALAEGNDVNITGFGKIQGSAPRRTSRA